eukprot:TRINITY_DN687_c0_g4_i1.p1 TRINITY_DN687_c0_g4~~TRINITY_DN687_c0_g4_i1.p1  ORF type:complete len:1707 (+),score=771.90 TRINITY_DN687_c0_g4_i1:229-5349(+)
MSGRSTRTRKLPSRLINNEEPLKRIASSKSESKKKAKEVVEEEDEEKENKPLSKSKKADPPIKERSKRPTRNNRKSYKESESEEEEEESQEERPKRSKRVVVESDDEEEEEEEIEEESQSQEEKSTSSKKGSKKVVVSSSEEEESEEEEEKPSKSKNQKKFVGKKKKEIVDSEEDSEEDSTVDKKKEAQKDKAINNSENRILNPADEGHLIELILGRRYQPLPSSESQSQSQSQSQGTDSLNTSVTSPLKSPQHKKKKQVNKKVIEYLVKAKGESYLHVEWMTEEAMKEGFSNAKGKIGKYIMENGEQVDEDFNEEFAFNTDYCEIDRIILTKKSGNHLLIKWKSLSYDDSTWEYRTTLKARVNNFDAKWEQYLKINSKQAKARAQVQSTRPDPKDYDKDDIQIPEFKGENALKDYQEEGFKWLVHCWFTRRSTILADEMGLGKTIQAISILQYLFEEQKVPGPFLIVAPMSTIEQWKRETEEWTNMIPIIYHGKQDARDLIYNYEWFFEGQQKSAKYYKFHVMIVTYEIAMIESSRLVTVPWQYLVVDEGHRLKNNQSKLFETLRKYRVAHKLILTGTPLQNGVRELWTLMNFLEPKKFNDVEGFMTEFGELKSSSQVEKLHKKLGPYMLRRIKSDVLKSIPQKEEILVEIELTSVQKTYYKAILERNTEFLTKSAAKSNLMNIMMQLRKCCNHPYLITGAEESILTNVNEDDEQVYGGKLISSSSKFVFVDQLLTRLRKEKKRVLIFSQMTRVLDLLEDYLNFKDWPFERLDGGIGRTERQAAIDRFSNKQMDRFVFLLGTRAGGLGINLTIADTVILFDSDWNPQNDVQAQCRAHRIGQQNTVKVYRLITRNTYEKTMFDVASKKLGLDKVVLGKAEGGDDAKNGIEKVLKKEEIERILKYGAYELFNDNGEEQNFDLDKILESSKKVDWNAVSEGSSESTLSSFSKATFVAAEADSTLDINDKHFWEKILPTFKTVARMKELLKDEEGLDTEEKRQKYIDDLEGVFKDFQQRQAERAASFSTSMENTNDFVSLLKKVTGCGKFSDEQQSKVYAWTEAVEKPRLRKRNATLMASALSRSALIGKDDTNDRDYGDIGSSSDSEVELDPSQVDKPAKGRESKKKSAPVEKGPPQWAKSHRERLKQALLLFGFGRWPEIAQNARIPERTEEEVKSFSEAIVDSFFPVIQEGEPGEKKTKNAKHRAFVRQLMKDSQHEIIKQMAVFRKLATEQDKLGHSTPITIKFKDSTGTEAIDTEFLQLVAAQDFSIVLKAKEGSNEVFRFLAIIKSDKLGDEPEPELVVRVIPVKEDDIGNEIHVKAPGFYGTYQVRCYSFKEEPLTPNEDQDKISKLYLSECGESGVFNVSPPPLLSLPEWVNSAGKIAAQSGWLNKLELLRGIQILCKKNSLKLNPIGMKPSAPWWTDKDDENLVRATHKYGYGKFGEMQKDESYDWTPSKLIERNAPFASKEEATKEETPKETKEEVQEDSKKEVKEDVKKEGDDEADASDTEKENGLFPSVGALNKRLHRLVEVALIPASEREKRKRVTSEKKSKKSTDDNDTIEDSEDKPKKEKKQKKEKKEKKSKKEKKAKIETNDDSDDFQKKLPPKRKKINLPPLTLEAHPSSTPSITYSTSVPSDDKDDDVIYVGKKRSLSDLLNPEEENPVKLVKTQRPIDSFFQKSLPSSVGEDSSNSDSPRRYLLVESLNS